MGWSCKQNGLRANWDLSGWLFFCQLKEETIWLRERGLNLRIIFRRKKPLD